MKEMIQVLVMRTSVVYVEIGSLKPSENNFCEMGKL